jgi:hypothetical protein
MLTLTLSIGTPTFAQTGRCFSSGGGVQFLRADHKEPVRLVSCRGPVLPTEKGLIRFGEIDDSAITDESVGQLENFASHQLLASGLREPLNSNDFCVRLVFAKHLFLDAMPLVRIQAFLREVFGFVFGRETKEHVEQNSRAISVVTKSDFGSHPAFQTHRDFRNDDQWAVGVESELGGLSSGFGGRRHASGNGDQLLIEFGNRNGRESGSDGKNGDYYRCCVAAIILFFIGGTCVWWGLRDIGRTDWRYLLLALVIAESGAFIWLWGWPWTWFGASVFRGA